VPNLYQLSQHEGSNCIRTAKVFPRQNRGKTCKEQPLTEGSGSTSSSRCSWSWTRSLGWMPATT
jgi:hypothetical protein